MTTTAVTSIEHIEATPGVIGGKPRIESTRIGVHDIKLWHLDHGRSIDDIATGHDLAPAQIHAALAYYYDHRQAVDAQIAEDEAYVQWFFEGQPSIVEKLGGERR